MTFGFGQSKEKTPAAPAAPSIEDQLPTVEIFFEFFMKNEMRKILFRLVERILS